MKRALLLLVVLLLAGCGMTAHRGAAPLSEEPRPVVVRGCEPLYHEPAGAPRLVIVSDLPLEASVRTAMHQMTQAIKLTLKDRGFRAGRWSVGYVVCDDSGSNGHFSGARCAENARRAAGVAHVVGVIGTLDSACARIELPILARAGIVMVGPLNTADDLTRAPGRYARLTASDSAQAAAAASFMAASGAKSATVFGDASRAGRIYLHAFVAHHPGLRLAGPRADAAYVAGALSARTPALLRIARSRTSGPVVLSETFGPAAQLASIAGTAAEGVYLAVAGTESARSFATQFEQALGAPPHPYAGYAAQAAGILLDAIASSDGSRASVRRHVFSGRAAGPLGTIAFDAHGEPRPAPVTVFRVEHGEARFVRVVDSAVP